MSQKNMKRLRKLENRVDLLNLYAEKQHLINDRTNDRLLELGKQCHGRINQTGESIKQSNRAILRGAREAKAATDRLAVVSAITAVALAITATVAVDAHHSAKELEKRLEAAQEAVQETQTIEVTWVEPKAEAPAIDPLQAEKEAIAKTVWGEARGCDAEGQEAVVWCILDRYDDGRFGDTICEVVSAPYQFAGYDPDYPVDPEIYDLVDGVMCRWLDGECGPGYLYFTGDGQHNIFAKEAQV